MNRMSSAFKKTATFGFGMAIKKTIDYGFDYLLYPLVLLYFGYLWGGITMTALSVLLNLSVIRAYDWSKRDWFLLETLKSVKSDGTDGRNGLLSYILKKGDIPAFFFLSWIEDPIIVTLYLRHGAHEFNGLSRRDWVIFSASTIVSNLFWMVSVISVIELLRFAF